MQNKELNTMDLQNQTLASIFEERAKISPSSIAIVHEEQSITYEQLNQSANQLASYLRDQGIKKGMLVAICAERSIAFVVAILGVVKAGGAYVPLDPSYPFQRIEYMLKDTGVTFILTSQKGLLSLPKTTAIITVLDEFYFRFKGYSKENLSNINDMNDLGYVIYTSGTTGVPKGVMIEQHSIINLVTDQNYIKLDSEITMLNLSALSFDATTFEIWGALLNGAKLVIVERNTLLDFSEFKQLIRKHSKVCLFMTVALFEKMVNEDPSIFKGCYYVIFGGDTCNVSVIKKYISQDTKSNLPENLLNGYGPSECTTFSTAYQVPIKEDITLIPIGTPLKNVSVAILDEKLKPVKDGKPGEICISGEGVSRGYLNQKALTDEKFIIRNGVRCYRTGDLGKIENHNIEFLGRLDKQIKIRGYRVEPAEIELVLQSLPDIEKAHITVEKDDDGEKELIAFLNLSKNLIRVLYSGTCQIKWEDEQVEDIKVMDISQGGICISGSNRKTVFREKISVILPEIVGKEEIKAEAIWQARNIIGLHFLKPNPKVNSYIEKYFNDSHEIILQGRKFRSILEKKLPQYMIPTHYFVLSSFPLTRNGKIDDEVLHEIYASQKEKHFGSGIEKDSQSEAEEIMIQLWREVLSVPDVGREDNFFSLGGHSLLATKILSKLRENYHANISFHDFFSNPMLSQLAILIENELEKSEYEPIPAVTRLRRISLSFGQERIWFFDRLLPECPLYNIPVVLRIKGGLIIEALQKAFEQLIERHEILQVFYAVDKQDVPYQRVATDTHLPLKIMDLASTEHLDEDALDEIFKEEANRIFFLTSGPLYRILLVEMKDDEFALMVTFHHSIADAWSFEIMFRDLSEFYNSYLNQTEPVLPLLPIQYLDYAVWQRGRLNSTKPYYNELVDFWKNHLKGNNLHPILPTDFPRPQTLSYQAGKIDFVIDKKLSSSIKGFSVNARCTLFMTLFSAFSVFINQLSGRSDIIIGTPIANRNRAEIDNLIGFFVNSLAIRIELQGNIGFNKLLNEVKKILLDAYEHQDLPFEKLVQEVVFEHGLHCHPVFQIMFVLQNTLTEQPKFKNVKTESVKEIIMPYTPFDLYMNLTEEEEEIAGFILYSTDLFREETIRHWIQQWIFMLQLISSNHQVKLNELKLF